MSQAPKAVETRPITIVTPSHLAGADDLPHYPVWLVRDASYTDHPSYIKEIPFRIYETIHDGQEWRLTVAHVLDEDRAIVRLCGCSLEATSLHELQFQTALEEGTLTKAAAQVLETRALVDLDAVRIASLL